MSHTDFMRDLEDRYKLASGLANRSSYKVFYGPVRQAPILTLGINPGGDPANTDASGLRHLTGTIAAASGTYYENEEHDLLDCVWRENAGLLKLLLPLLGNDRERIRREVVKTNLAFRRSSKAAHINIEAAKFEAQPFLAEIIRRVQPRLVLLTGARLDDFIALHTREVVDRRACERDVTIGHVVFLCGARGVSCHRLPRLGSAGGTCFPVQLDL